MPVMSGTLRALFDRENALHEVPSCRTLWITVVFLPGLVSTNSASNYGKSMLESYLFRRLPCRRLLLSWPRLA